MGRKKPVKHSVKNRRYKVRSNAAMNGGVTETGKRLSPERKAEVIVEDRAGNDRLLENHVRRMIVREQWKGLRHQGSETFNRIVVREIAMYFRLSLLFHGREWFWVFDDWRCSRRKISILYGSKDRAFQVLSIDPDKMSGIVWKTEVDLEGGTVR